MHLEKMSPTVMLRKTRIDVPWALHHIIARGIARKKVFDDNADRDFFVGVKGSIKGSNLPLTLI